MLIRAVYPGTFDPIHYGHIDIAVRAARLFSELIVAVYDRPLKSLLLSPEERLELVKTAFRDVANIQVTGYSGLTVDYCRKVGAQVIVRGLRVFSDFEHEFRMALTNQHLAPDIDVVAFFTNEEHTFLSSTMVREVVSLGGDIKDMVPPYVAEVLKRKFQGQQNEDLKMTYMTSLRD